MERRKKLLVHVVCSRKEVTHSGEWDKGDTPEEVLSHLRQKALEHDMPIQVEIFGHGIWSITPDGRVMRVALFV